MNGPRLWAMLLAPGFLAPAAVYAQAPSATDDESELRVLLATMGDPEHGKAVFVQCEDCHRKAGSGRSNGAFPRLAGQHVSVVLKQLVDIRSGRRDNPAMQALLTGPLLARSDIADVAVYIHSLPVPANNGKGPGTNLTMGRQLYERDCAACHGAAGEGDAAKFHPMLAAQHYRYLVREIATIRDGERRNADPEMVKLIKPYSAVEIEAVPDYISQMSVPRR